MSGATLSTSFPTSTIYDKGQAKLTKTNNSNKPSKTSNDNKNIVQNNGNSSEPITTNNVKKIPDSDFDPKNTNFNVNKATSNKEVKSSTLGNLGASIQTKTSEAIGKIASGLSAVGASKSTKDPIVKTVQNIEDGVETGVDKLNDLSKKVNYAKKGQTISGLDKLPKEWQIKIAEYLKKLPETKAVKFVDALNKSLFGKWAITNPEQFSKVLSNVTKGLGIAGGGLEILQGIIQLKKGDTYEGGWSLAKGTSTLVSVFTKANMAGLAVYALYKGDKATKEYGWFKDEKGNNISAVENLISKSKNSFQAERKKNGTVSAVLLTATTAPGRIAVATVSMAGGFVISTVDNVGKGMKKVGDKIDKFGKNLEDKSVNMIKKGNFAEKVVGAGGYTIAKATQAVGKFVNKTGEIFCKGADIAKKYFGQAVNWTEKKLDQFSNFVSNTISDVKKAVSNTVGEVKKAVTNTVNKVTNAISNTVGDISRGVSNFFSSIF
ncbi:MAG: hypothetical protein U0354_05130 [Candidatus Sericytochromatia bacterium]